MCSTRTNRVVKGAGIFHPPKAQYSEDTHKLLKVLMDESKLTILQRKHLQNSISKGDSLPVPQQGTGRNPTQTRPAMLTLRPTASGRRTQEAIIQSGAYEREKFVPMHPKVDKVKEKRTLQCLMAYGKEMPPTPCGKSRRRPLSVLETPNESERFQELVQEVRDRIQFLSEMKELGQEKKYRVMIHQEIAAKIRQMEAIDKQKCKELQEFFDEPN